MLFLQISASDFVSVSGESWRKRIKDVMSHPLLFWGCNEQRMGAGELGPESLLLLTCHCYKRHQKPKAKHPWIFSLWSLIWTDRLLKHSLCIFLIATLWVLLMGCLWYRTQMVCSPSLLTFLSILMTFFFFFLRKKKKLLTLLFLQFPCAFHQNKYVYTGDAQLPIENVWWVLMW